MWLMLLLACPSETTVNAAIADAQACTATEECVDIGTQCPFGCNILVNEAEADHVKSLLDQYAKAHGGMACMYDCIAPGPISCEAGQCTHLEVTDTGTP